MDGLSLDVFGDGAVSGLCRSNPHVSDRVWGAISCALGEEKTGTRVGAMEPGVRECRGVCSLLRLAAGTSG